MRPGDPLETPLPAFTIGEKVKIVSNHYHGTIGAIEWDATRGEHAYVLSFKWETSPRRWQASELTHPKPHLSSFAGLKRSCREPFQASIVLWDAWVSARQLDLTAPELLSHLPPQWQPLVKAAAAAHLDTEANGIVMGTHLHSEEFEKSRGWVPMKFIAGLSNR